MKFPTRKGQSTPLGISRKTTGINFALYSERAVEIILCLFLPGTEHPFLEVFLDPDKNRTDNVWHVTVSNLPANFEYSYRVKGPFNPEKCLVFNDNHTLCDPYASSLTTSNIWGVYHQAYSKKMLRGRVSLLPPFDWDGVTSPKIPLKDLIIYEMHVRAFTQDASSNVKHKGTFLGIREKIPHLKKLGINAVELLPIFEFDENEYEKMNPITKSRLFNFWGYSTVNFFSPMNRYASAPAWHTALIEFKTLVKELHKAGIEVILDVVYNHTAEGNENGPALSFKGIDNSTYYMHNENGNYMNYSGCGNTFNCNHPACHQLIIDSLRYWVKEMHVDGFRFDLASILTRDQDGTPLKNPPVIEAINADQILSKVKLIAEAWDCGGLYQVGSFPGKGKWAEWNGPYRDIARRFIKGTDHQAGAFAGVLSGSENLYEKTKHPYNSVNFITAHDGYTLKDLVSYQKKHNLDNGESNLDGTDHNESWNCGEEGITSNQEVVKIRERQMRNLHLALMVSLGIPMVLMGDEYQHTRLGNNNVWCQDNELNWFQWDLLKKNKSFFRFFTHCIKLRKNNPLLRRTSFLDEKDIEWHGHKPLAQNWGETSRFVAYTLKDPHNKHSLYIAFNAHFEEAPITLPSPPKGKRWYRLVDTSLASPHDIEDDPTSKPALNKLYTLPAHAALVLKSH